MIIQPAATPMDAESAATAEVQDEESTLLRRWRERGEREALEALAARLADLGYRVARAILVDRAEAEDAVQDAFVRLLSKADQWRGDRPVRGWFAVTVANTARSRLRAARVRRRGVPVEPLSPSPPASEERALATLAQLPEDQRLPIWLHVVEGMTCRDIARSLGQNEGTVRSRVSRGLDRLRERLGGAAALTPLASMRVPGGLVARLALAKPMTAGAGLTGIAAAVAGLLALVSAIVVIARAGAPEHSAVASRIAADPPPAAVAPPGVLDQAVAVLFRHESLADAIAAIDRALPPGERIAWAGPRRYPDEPYAGASWTTVGPAPVRAILDQVASELRLRWIESDGGAIFTREMDPQRRAALASRLADPNEERGRREDAAFALATSCDVLSVRELMRALGEGDDTVADIVTALFLNDLPPLSLPAGPWSVDGISPFAALRGDREVDSALVSRLRKDVAAGKPRWEVVELCGYLGLAEARPVIDALAARPNTATKRAQGWYADARALDQILARPDWRTDFIAYESLGASRDPRAADALTAIVGDASLDGRHRAYAAEGLAHAPPTPSAVEALAAVLKDPLQPVQLRGVAARCLGEAGAAAGVPALAAALDASDLADNDQAVGYGPTNLAETIVEAMTWLHDRRATPAVLSALARSGGKPITVRSAIFRYAYAMADPALTDAFAKLMKDPGADLTVAFGPVPTSTAGAAMVLGAIGTDASLGVLRGVVRGERYEAAAAAWEGLARTRSPEVVDELIVQVGSDDARLRSYLYRPLIDTRDRRALDAVLRGALGERDPQARHAALGAAVKRIDGTSAFWLAPADIADPALLRGLVDEAVRPGPNDEVEVLAWACGCIDALPAEERSRVLARLRGDPDPRRRIAMISLIPWRGSAAGDEAIAAVVERIAGDPDAAVRANACSACGHAYEQPGAARWRSRVIGPLSAALRDPEAVVANLARSKLEDLAKGKRDPEAAAAAARALAEADQPAKRGSAGF